MEEKEVHRRHYLSAHQPVGARAFCLGVVPSGAPRTVRRSERTTSRVSPLLRDVRRGCGSSGVGPLRCRLSAVAVASSLLSYCRVRRYIKGGI